MSFGNIPAGTLLFLDANTFVYYFVPHPVLGPACKQLMERLTRQELSGFTSTHVLSDVAHRVMTMEAISQFGWPAKGIAQRLRHNHVAIRKLTRFRQAIDEVPLLGIQVLPVLYHHTAAAALNSQQYELLSGDALVVAVMRDHGPTHVASHDRDFDRVPGITRYVPA